MFLCRANDTAVSETSFMTSGADEGQAQLMGEAKRSQATFHFSQALLMQHRLVRFNKAGFVMFLRKHTTNTEPVRTDEGMLCCLFIFKLAIRRKKSFLWRSGAASSSVNFF